jgi:hypothetical protein
MPSEDRKTTRRALLQAGGVLGSLHAFRPLLPAAAPPAGTVRDRLWLWSHVAGSYNGKFNLPGKSRMTPAEAGFYMGIPNIFMIHLAGQPEPPLAQYALAFEPLREVVWGIVAAGGHTNAQEREMVLELALENPQISGVVMDDFFRGKKEGKIASLTVEEVRALKERLVTPRKKLDLSVVLYEHQLEPEISEHLKLCDVVQFWTWRGENLDHLAANFKKAEQLVPGKRMALGIYWWDFGNSKPLPMPAMRRQCELGLEWLQQGRIEAMIFCGSWMCDRGLDTVAWTREWIRRVGGQKLRAAVRKA